MERSIENSFFDYLDNLPTSLLITTMRQIHALMQVNRRRLNELPETEIKSKLKNSRHHKKPGEEVELAEAFNAEANCPGITPKIASELADHAYYRLMENVGPQESFDKWYTKDSTLEFMGIDSRLVIIFGIIKYSKRIDYGRDPRYKEIEYEELSKYLKLHPELLTLWSTTDNNQDMSRETWRTLDETQVNQ